MPFVMLDPLRHISAALQGSLRESFSNAISDWCIENTGFSRPLYFFYDSIRPDLNKWGAMAYACDGWPDWETDTWSPLTAEERAFGESIIYPRD